MARENHRSQCAPAGGTLLPATRRAGVLTPTSQERAAGRRPEARGHEVASPDSLHRPHSVGSVGCTFTDTASVPHQAATVELQWSSVGDTQQWGISHRGRAAQALEESFRYSWAEQKL